MLNNGRFHEKSVQKCAQNVDKLVANPDSYGTHGGLILLSALSIARRYLRKRYPSTLIISKRFSFLNTYLKPSSCLVIFLILSG